MGLDMYLKARRFVSGWDPSDSEQKLRYDVLLQLGEAHDLITKESPSAYIEITAAYWRKANQIHNWFVQNVQDGKDECQSSYVSREQLVTLVDLCHRALAKRDSSLLPPVDGFFFGGTSIDGYYWEDLETTIKQLQRCLTASDDWSFAYQASW